MAGKNQNDPLSSLFRATVDPSEVPEPTPLPRSFAEAPEPQIRPVKSVERPMPPKPAGPDPAALAKILAKAAAAKAGKPAKPAAAPKAEARPARAEPAPAPRVAGIAAAPPPAKKMSAAEALEAARVAEAAKAAAPPPVVATPPAPVATPAPAPVAAAPAAPVSPGAVSDACQDIVGFALPNAAIYVPHAVIADDRGTLRPLWKAHRARLVAKGDIERAATCAAVVEALTSRPAGSLAYAQLHLDEGDYLGWFDLHAKAIVGVLPDPSGWGMKLE